MSQSKEKPYGLALAKLMAEKTQVLSQAQVFGQMGLTQTAQPLWEAAAALDFERDMPADDFGRSARYARGRLRSPRSLGTNHRFAVNLGMRQHTPSRRDRSLSPYTSSV